MFYNVLVKKSNETKIIYDYHDKGSYMLSNWISWCLYKIDTNTCDTIINDDDDINKYVTKIKKMYLE